MTLSLLHAAAKITAHTRHASPIRNLASYELCERWRAKHALCMPAMLQSRGGGDLRLGHNGLKLLHFLCNLAVIFSVLAGLSLSHAPRRRRVAGMHCAPAAPVWPVGTGALPACSVCAVGCKPCGEACAYTVCASGGYRSYIEF